MNLTIDQHAVLIHYIHDTPPENFDAKTIESALMAIKLNRWTCVEGKLVIPSRFYADDYIVRKMPTTFKTLKQEGVDFENFTPSNITSIVTLNYGPVFDPSTVICIEKQTLTSYIQECGFPMDLSFEEHSVLVSILHSKNIRKFNREVIADAERVIRLTIKRHVNVELVKILDNQRTQLINYSRRTCLTHL
jgi:hypothetical protein